MLLYHMCSSDEQFLTNVIGYRMWSIID